MIKNNYISILTNWHEHNFYCKKYNIVKYSLTGWKILVGENL